MVSVPKEARPACWNKGNDSNSFHSYHEISSQQSARPLPTHALESSWFSIEAAHSVFMANLASLQTTVQAAFSSLAFSARTLKSRKTPAHQAPGAKVQQVWSLTQIFSLDFLQSRIIAKNTCILIKVCEECLLQFSDLHAEGAWGWPYISVLPEAKCG